MGGGGVVEHLLIITVQALSTCGIFEYTIIKISRLLCFAIISYCSHSSTIDTAGVGVGVTVGVLVAVCVVAGLVVLLVVFIVRYRDHQRRQERYVGQT